MARKKKPKAPGPTHLRLVTGDELGLVKEILVPLEAAPAPPSAALDDSEDDEGFADGDGLDMYRAAPDPSYDPYAPAPPPPPPSVAVVDAPPDGPARARGCDVAAVRRTGGAVRLLLGRADGSAEVWASEGAPAGVPATYTKVASYALPPGADDRRYLGGALPSDGEAVLCDAAGYVHTFVVAGTALVAKESVLALTGGPADSDPRISNVTSAAGVVAATCACCTPDGAFVALAGRGRETVLYDVINKKIAWRAKNLPPDPVTQLQRPVWSTAVALYDDGGPLPMVAVGTAFGQVRLYDPNGGRRPVAMTKVVGDGDGRRFGAERSTTTGTAGDFRVTQLRRWRDRQFLAGDAAGYLRLLDFAYTAKTGKGGARLMRTFDGFAGSVRGLHMGCEGKNRYAAACGLDRTAGVLDLYNGKVVAKIYLKQRMNFVVVCPVEVQEGVLPATTEDDEVVDYVDSDGDEEHEADSSAEGSDNESMESDRGGNWEGSSSDGSDHGEKEFDQGQKREGRTAIAQSKRRKQ